MLDAAPNLWNLWLERVSVRSEGLGLQWHDVMSKRRALLRCPKTLVHVTLIHCHDTDGLYLEAPNVHFLRYEGYLQHFPFNSTMSSGLPLNLEHAYLSFCTRCRYQFPKEHQPHGMFWELVGRFSRLRVLKLNLKYISDIAVHPEQQKRFLKLFPDLEVLKVKGSYEVENHDAAVAIANLFHCCPAMEEFRLKVHREPTHAFHNHWTHQTDETRVLLDLENSMKSLTMLNSKMSPLYYDVHGHSHRCDGIDLSSLQGYPFSCLDSQLRKNKIRVSDGMFQLLWGQNHQVPRGELSCVGEDRSS
ncbi:hypothetical protein PR202_ga31326 [Eleusine coracana subsp. coracana]|uniref:FBD domain-containing protein n=1 Tax=Eleusine coracana subsp. coracana TaxID=191504 RepID=A0AAV5DRR2_ELECO|nr:hypothetical protein PR202_ga31326 [Eleusine coracana subsp. coracana]